MRTHCNIALFVFLFCNVPTFQKNCHAVQRAGAMERIPIGIAGMAWLGQILIVFHYPCVTLAGTPAVYARERKLQGLDPNLRTCNTNMKKRFKHIGK